MSGLLQQLLDAGEIDGVVCMGGAGTHIAGPGLQELPLGFPKLIVSPLASGSRTFDAYVGIRDVAVMHSVADIIGVNNVTTPIYRSAAGYIYGAALAYAHQARRWLTRTLQAEVEDGLLTEAEAIALASRLMRENQYACFRVAAKRQQVAAEAQRASS